MLYDTHRTDMLPHIMSGRSQRSQAFHAFLRYLIGRRNAMNVTGPTGSHGQTAGI